MSGNAVDLGSLAIQLGRSPRPTTAEAAALRTTHLCFAGYGSIARPLAEQAAEYGARNFTLVDPKKYFLRSTTSQCMPSEVGRPKIDVGSERLRVLGGDVTAFAWDLYTVAEGVIDSQTIVVASMDNRRGDIRANRMAAASGARLLKINIEPAMQIASLRAYDFRHEVSRCAECQFTSRYYEQQRHPRSCDGGGDVRRTNSPRWLSQLAGHLGILAVLDLVADDRRMLRWCGREWQYSHETGGLRCSELVANAHCRWDHRRRWSNVQRLQEGPDRLCIRELLDAAGAGDHARVRFCQQVSLRARCRDCAREAQEPRWLCEPSQPIDICSSCGGSVDAVPFWTFSELDAGQLATVADRPMSSWGVAPYAMIEIRRTDRAITFVVGNASGRKRFNSTHERASS